MTLTTMKLIKLGIFLKKLQFNNERYLVELLFRKNWKELSDNFSVAKQRFQNLWRRLQRDEIFYSQYQETIQDYLNQGIIEIVKNTEANIPKPIYYLPHQAIKKEGRVTTFTRIEFEAASHQIYELSFNDCLRPGPNLNPNLLDVLINFRKSHPITVRHLDSFMYVDDWIAGPSDLLSRVLSADSLLSDDKWWNGPSFLQFDELSGTDSEFPDLNEEEYLPEL
ncbi:DUF1758 domain-containing protein [Nephila pilipes]|uniref:DUF1758 domain-containing protein n=1 Tax=Nephila pilipes TaxID=299642 RepID=A0A8X6N5E4_NEPPI|nr:DUF1758 domain-containing protein [Nephila pilipes]